MSCWTEAYAPVSLRGIAVTSDMQLLFDRLYHQPAVQQAYLDDPAQAVSEYDITAHERDAVVTKDVDDLVALGLAPSIEELPEVVRGTRAPGQPPGLLDRIRDALKKILGRAPGIDTGPDRPDIPRPRPRPDPPGPGPGPGPRPDPPRRGPGPDPPDPDMRPRGPGG
jgi:hypothetical protein